MGVANAGCLVDPSETKTSSFELAEEAYRRGTYSEALDGYEDFLKRHPTSPLAKVAKQRIRCINREVRSMLGRSDSPRPVYRADAQTSTRD